MLIRAQEMARYVEDGILDAGLTGRDWIEENEARGGSGGRPDLRQAELRQSALGAGRAGGVRLSHRSKDLEGKIIATELVATTRRYLAAHGVTAQGGIQLGRHRGEAAGAGRCHRRSDRNRLVAARQQAQDHRHGDGIEHPVDRQSRRRGRTPASGASWKTCTMLLEGAINALGKVGLMLNVHQDNLQAVLAVLPALKRPTISHLSDEEWLAVNTILDESTVRDIIPRLKQAGGAGNRGVSAEQDRAVIRNSQSTDSIGAAAWRRKAARLARRRKQSVRPILEAVRAARRHARCWNTRASSTGLTRKTVRVPAAELQQAARGSRRSSATPSRPRPPTFAPTPRCSCRAENGCAKWVPVCDLGQVVRPLDTVAAYIPAGRYPLPSTLMMTVIPAQVAGVPNICVASPARACRRFCGTAHLLGVRQVFQMGGAQAIAAFAYGTRTCRAPTASSDRATSMSPPPRNCWPAKWASTSWPARLRS